MVFPEHGLIEEILTSYARQTGVEESDGELQRRIESFHIQLLTLTHQELAWVHQEWCV